MKKSIKKLLIIGIATTIYMGVNSTLISASVIKSDIVDNPILIPSKLYILKESVLAGKTQYIFDDNVDLMSQEARIMKVESSYGSIFNDGWKFSKQNIVGNMPHNFQVKYSTPYNGEAKVMSVEVVDKSNNEEVRLLAIGDSLTRAGEYLNEVDEQIDNITFYRTRV